MIELEKTYLIKYLPENLNDREFKEVVDVYIPKTADHPKTRIRKSGDKFEITKKEPVNKGDASHQKEQTIKLTEEEFNELSKIPGKRISKKRYNYNYKSRIAEIDIFQKELEGLVVVDFEFVSIEEKDKFEIPDFCLVDITQEKFIAGGKICGKSYNDIEKELKRFGYKKIKG